MGEVKIANSKAGKIYLGDMQILGGLTLEVNNSITSSHIITLINNTSKEVLVRLEDLDSNFVVIYSVDVYIPAKSVLVRPSFAAESHMGGRPNTRFSILTDVRYTSYSYVNSNNTSKNGTAFDIEYIVGIGQNVFDYKASPRYGGTFSGTFIFNEV